MMCVIHAAAHVHTAHISDCLAKSRWIGCPVTSLELRDRTVGPRSSMEYCPDPGCWLLTEDSLKIKRNRGELQQSACSCHLGLV